MNLGKTEKKKSKKGFFMTMGALMALGAMTVVKKSKMAVNTVMEKDGND